MVQRPNVLAKSVYVKGGVRGVANIPEKISKNKKSLIGGEQGEETVFDMLDELS